MRLFQACLVLLLVVIAFELAVVALKMPAAPVFAQPRAPVPVVINDGLLSEGRSLLACVCETEPW